MIKGTKSFVENLFISATSIQSDGYIYISSVDVLKLYLAYRIDLSHLNLIQFRKEIEKRTLLIYSTSDILISAKHFSTRKIFR